MTKIEFENVKKQCTKRYCKLEIYNEDYQLSILLNPDWNLILRENGTYSIEEIP